MSNGSKVCSFAGCGRCSRSNGLCSGHYAQQRRGQALRKLASKSLTVGMTDAQRFEHYVDRSGACHVWVGSKTSQGYGQMRFGSANRLAHRVAYEMAFGSAPAELLVRHSCDNPSCVRLDHLSLGTHQQNSGDAMARERVANGERTPSFKLTDRQVADIRAVYAAGACTQKGLADKYSVSLSQVSRIVRARSRKVPTYEAL